MQTKEKKFRHLTWTDRVRTETMLNNGCTQADVARYLGVNRSTVSREVKKGLCIHRNSDYTEEMRYAADRGQAEHEWRMTALGKSLKIGNDFKYVKRLEALILDNYSPQAALAEIKKNHEKYSVTISVPTFYRYIHDKDKCVFTNISEENLVQYKKKRKKKEKPRQKRASVGTGIDSRPADILDRMEFGNWEIDTVKGKRGTTKSCLLVLSERKTRKELVFKLPDQKAASVVSVLDEIENFLGYENFTKVFKTITADNGVEFADFSGMERSASGGRRTSVFYCHAYSSWERGTNENINRMIRRHIPKGRDIDKYDDDYIGTVETWINNYPRRMFGYDTSQERYLAEMDRLGLAGLDIGSSSIRVKPRAA